MGVLHFHLHTLLPHQTSIQSTRYVLKCLDRIIDRQHYNWQTCTYAIYTHIYTHTHTYTCYMHTYRDNTETMGIATIGRNILDIKIALILQMFIP